MAVGLERHAALAAQGRISQEFGCTGFPLEPAYGDRAHFHRGIDVVSDYGCTGGRGWGRCRPLRGLFYRREEGRRLVGRCGCLFRPAVTTYGDLVVGDGPRPPGRRAVWEGQVSGWMATPATAPAPTSTGASGSTTSR